MATVLTARVAARKDYREMKPTEKKGGRPRTRARVEKVCERKGCGITFTTVNPKTKYHSLECSRIARRKVKDRPEPAQLRADVAELGWEGTGRKYGVTFNAVKSWARACGILPPDH